MKDPREERLEKFLSITGASRETAIEAFKYIAEQGLYDAQDSDPVKMARTLLFATKWKEYAAQGLPENVTHTMAYVDAKEQIDSKTAPATMDDYFPANGGFEGRQAPVKTPSGVVFTLEANIAAHGGDYVLKAQGIQSLDDVDAVIAAIRAKYAVASWVTRQNAPASSASNGAVAVSRSEPNEEKSRDIVALRYVRYTNAKGNESPYYEPFYWDEQDKTLKKVGRIWAQSKIGDILQTIVKATIAEDMPTTLPDEQRFRAWYVNETYTANNGEQRKAANFTRIEKVS